MNYYVYIIFSDSIQKHYVGISESLERRLEAHNNGISQYTSKVSDWLVIYATVLPSKTEALILERK